MFAKTLEVCVSREPVIKGRIEEKHTEEEKQNGIRTGYSCNDLHCYGENYTKTSVMNRGPWTRCQKLNCVQAWEKSVTVKSIYLQ